jgi:predicted transcriptional regulator
MKTPIFTIRLRPDARRMLDKAADEQRRSRASIVEELIRTHLARFQDVSARLERMGVR